MNPKLKQWLLVLVAPVLYALVMRLVFDLASLNPFFAVMSIAFLLGVPFAIGYLTIYFSPIEAIQKETYRALIPWISDAIFLATTLLLKIEGFACWVMVLPVFLIFSSAGGLVAGRRRFRRQKKQDRLRVSIVLLLPFMVVPLEHLIPDSATRYEAYTHIDLQAPAGTIWNNVVRVRTIEEEEDHGGLTRFLKFPRPVRAELDYAGVGGRRQAIFSKGLVFEEVVLDYTDRQRMHFSIKADSRSIPPTTMDRHIIIGGQFFDVLDGTYELVPLAGGGYRLNLYSHFTLKTRFNFYAHWWAGWIMKDIQNNILQVIRKRCADH
jgi:hypothetical protein